MILVNSYGGCANTLLIEQIKNFGLKLVFDGGDLTSRCKKFKHIKTPPPAKIKTFHHNGEEAFISKVIYLYSDPIEAINTFFRRRRDGVDHRGPIQDWVIGHCFNIKGDWMAISPEWDIDDYANQQKDLLCLTEHFLNWKNTPTEYPILYVKYENMWENLDKISEFLELDSNFVNSFPKKRSRKRSISEIKKETLDMLNKTYEQLITETKNSPECYKKNAIYNQ